MEDVQIVMLASLSIFIKSEIWKKSGAQSKICARNDYMYCSFASDTLKVTSNLRKLFSIFLSVQHPFHLHWIYSYLSIKCGSTVSFSSAGEVAQQKRLMPTGVRYHLYPNYDIHFSKY